MPNAIIYCRVSTKDQVDRVSLDTQEQLCRGYAQREGIEVVQVFRELGESAKTANGTELRNALAFCRKAQRSTKAVDILIMYSVEGRREALEGRFEEYLTTFQPEEELLPLFLALAEQEFETQASGLAEVAKRVQRQVAATERKKQRLLEAFLYEKTIDPEIYQAEKARLEAEEFKHASELRLSSVSLMSKKRLTGFTLSILQDLSGLWCRLDSDAKILLQSSILPLGVTYLNGTYLNPVNCSFFRGLQPSFEGKNRVVAPTGFEPVSPA